jgi:membrane protease YdiL (CAAX protease family)
VDLAVTGIVYSMMTAAAMWQNFRARLPYLFDPWSEVLPTPPTLMHAMIAISVLVEAGAIFAGGSSALARGGAAAPLMVIAYAICASVVSAGTLHFLRGRGVGLAKIWFWPAADGGHDRPPRYLSMAFIGPFVAAAALAGALGLAAHGYLWIASHLPVVAAQREKARMVLDAQPHLGTALFIMAVFIAPFAEEFLFRGLLYRALDHEWGGWRAIAGSAAFFASYHPVLSWLPVFLLGALNALIFKRTGRLGPSILTHMVYNAVVLA